MARVKIINEGITLEVPEGARILEYAMDNTNIQYGCKKGECGFCICTIMKGIENLDETQHEEWLLLQKIKTNNNQRLGCQIRVKKEGEIEVEY